MGQHGFMPRLALCSLLLFTNAFGSAQTAKTAKTAQTSQSVNAALPTGVKLVKKGTVIGGMPEVEKYVFDNGLQLLFIPDNRNPVATLRTYLDAGSNRERPGITGLAHFFEHMMFRKTKEQPEGQFDRTLSGIGGSGNAGTSSDYVVYESVFPGPALDIMIDLEKRRMTALDLTDPYFTTEKGAVISERRMRYENNPQQRGFEFINRITERGTQREWLTIGTREDVQNMKISDAQAFYETFYVPSNALITIGGPFRSVDVVSKVHAAFANWSSANKVPPHAPLPKDYFTRDAGKTFICREAVGEQSLKIVFPSSVTSYDDLIMAHIFGELLDDSSEGSMTRRLTNADLATGFMFYKMYWQSESQPLVAHFSLAGHQKPEAAFKKFAEETAKITKLKWNESFRKRLQKKIDLDKANAAEKMTSLVENYEWNETNYGDFLISKRYQTIVDKLTVAALQDWIKKNLDFSRSFSTGVTGMQEYPPCAELTVAGVKK
jgi:zinc protease